jgi:molybdate transport system substrate-binding protein
VSVSPAATLCGQFAAGGHDAVHWSSVGDPKGSDATLLSYARQTRRSAVIALVAALAACALPAHAAAAQKPELLVFAASSLTDVLNELGALYTKESGQTVKFSYAASSVLARQIESGARADAFLSADGEWMDYLERRNLIDKSTRKNLLGNELVLVAPADSTVKVKIAKPFPLANVLGDRRLATGDPESVPVGRYAKAALTSLGAWDSIAARLVRAENVRAALGFVARGEAMLGIVYATDARVEKKVRIVDTFPASSHPPIVYPVATSAKPQNGARELIQFLSGKKAAPVFEKYGFTVLH